jgi:steroid 5-alpha reductase family enzyme
VSMIGLVIIGVFTSILLMTISWALAAKLDFYSLVDVAWSYGVGLVGVIYAILGSEFFKKDVAFVFHDAC